MLEVRIYLQNGIEKGDGKGPASIHEDHTLE